MSSQPDGYMASEDNLIIHHGFIAMVLHCRITLSHGVPPQRNIHMVGGRVEFHCYGFRGVSSLFAETVVPSQCEQLRYNDIGLWRGSAKKPKLGLCYDSHRRREARVPTQPGGRLLKSFPGIRGVCGMRVGEDIRPSCEESGLEAVHPSRRAKIVMCS